jgi:hypothetical protein
MIGQISSSGKMGNALFQWIFLRQISDKLQESIFHTRWKELTDFLDTGYRLDEPFSLSRGFRMVGLEELNKMGKDQFLVECGKILQRRNILLGPGILGSHFFEFTEKDPREIVKPLNSLGNNETLEKPYAALHFRGLDFHQWNTSAVMDYRFYENSVISLMNEVGDSEYPIKLVTDDPEHPVVEKILTISKTISLMRQGSRMADFRILARSSFLVASPSTFSFWGGLLGRDKTIIHSKEWVESRANYGENFWINILERKEFHGHRFRQV